MRQRVNAGLKAARRRGRLGGRPKSLTEADLKKARALLRSGDYTACAPRMRPSDLRKMSLMLIGLAPGK